MYRQVADQLAAEIASGELPPGHRVPSERVIAERHGLWILADEVYEDYVYGGGARHVSIAATHLERTVSVYSFAKSYAQAGLRIGYAIAPEPVAFALRKLVNHSVYNVPTVLQHAAH